jgi:hypothetical protein
VLSGCALGPSATTTPPSSNVEKAQARHEYPAPPPPRQTAASAAPTPIAAVRSFGSGYINWRAATVAATMSSLASRSVGQARSAMQLAAAQAAHDYELQRGGVANTGTVEAIAPLAGHRHEYVVVTLEQTTATSTTAYQGLRPAWHLTLATVLQLTKGQWVVSRWQPET